MSEPRPSLHRLAPGAMQAILAVEEVVRGELDHGLLELVKLRASMINGCALCVDMHLRDLLEHGEDVRRVGAVAAWRESPFFTTAERAALALTDAITEIGEDGVPDDVWDAAVAAHGEGTVGHLIIAIGLINLWNRAAISTRQAPPPLADAAA